MDELHELGRKSKNEKSLKEAESVKTAKKKSPKGIEKKNTKKIY